MAVCLFVLAFCFVLGFFGGFFCCFYFIICGGVSWLFLGWLAGLVGFSVGFFLFGWFWRQGEGGWGCFGVFSP